jgi:hypothetical protein
VVRAVVGKAVRLDFSDAKADAAVPELLTEEVAGDVEGIARVELARE